LAYVAFFSLFGLVSELQGTLEVGFDFFGSDEFLVHLFDAIV
jgi:hypothetical protein